MKDVFIPTQNFQNFQELCQELLTSSIGVDLAVVLGPYGRGKTKIAERTVAMNPQVLYVCFEPRMSLAGLIREVAFAVAGIRPRGTDACVEAIADELGRQRRLILVDEADQMTLKHLNQLRSFHDLHHVPIVLLGEDALHRKLGREGRLLSRVREVLKLAPLSHSDVVVFYRKSLDLALKPEQSARILKHARGDFRNVVKDAIRLERIMRSSGLKDLDGAVIEEVFQ